MGTEEKVIEALRKLPPERQAEVLDFVEFLRARQSQDAPDKPGHVANGERQEDTDAPQPPDGSAFPQNTIEASDTPPVYRGRPLSLAQMREAVDWEASGAK